MKEVITSRIPRTIPLLIAVCLISFPAQPQYGGGTGEPNDPYLIYTAEQMNAIGADSNDWDKHFKLMADIDLAAYTRADFNIIGRSLSVAFRGVFDGNAKKILNFSYKCTGVRRIGLFGCVRDGVVKDLGLIDPNVDVGEPTAHVGSLIGLLRGAISNCYAREGSVSGQNAVGGLVGMVGHDSVVTACFWDTQTTGRSNMCG